MMKKSLLALAVAALSANAFAVNLDDNTGVTTYAKEIAVASTGTTLAGATASATAGFALATDGYVRFELTNGAKFKTITGLVSTPAPATSTYSIANGGVGQNFVIFRTDGGGVKIDDVLTLTATYDVVNKDAVGISYSLYETAANAVAKTGALNTKSGTLLSFASALAVSAVDAGPFQIDAITSESKKFASFPAGNTTSLLTLTVGDAAGTQAAADGVTDVTAAAALAATSKWSLSGNFSAVAANGLVAGATPFVVAADKQSAELVTTTGGLVSYTVTGADEIAETSISATFTPVANAGYEVAPVSFANVTKLEKNGTTVDVDLALKPDGVYRNFVRISNKDTISGAFFIKVINDAGQSVSFPLSDVAGQPATLAAGASTTQINITDIYAAAQAKGFEYTGQGKLRLEVTGQTNDLDVQTYTISKDANSFATF